MSKTKTYKNNMPIGCYFDGSFGQTYNSLRVLELALEHGWKSGEALDLLETTDEDDLMDDEVEFLSEVVDEAVEYLNEQETRTGLFWQWYEGDFGLYVDIDSAKEVVEFVSSEDQEYPVDDYQGEWLHVNERGNCTLYLRENGKDKEIWSVV